MLNLMAVCQLAMYIVAPVYNGSFNNALTLNRGVSHYRILPISRDIGWPVQQLDYFRYKAPRKNASEKMSSAKVVCCKKNA